MSSSFDFSKSKIPAKLNQAKTSKSTGVKELEYDDKRGESVAQLKLQDAADNSKSVNNLVDIEEQANNSENVTQLMNMQNTLNEPQTQDKSIQNQENPLQLKSSNDAVIQMGSKAGTMPTIKEHSDREISGEEIKGRQDAAAENDAEAKAKSRKPKVEHLKPKGPKGYIDDEDLFNLLFKGFKVKFSLDDRLYNGFLQAQQLHNKANDLIKKSTPPTIECMNEVIVLMSSINDLGKIKGVVRSRQNPRGEEKELSELVAFNKLFIDPTKYIPEKQIEEHASHFNDGAVKIDRIDMTGGFEFDWGMTFLGERGAQFFGPRKAAEDNIKEARNKRGIPEFEIILKLGNSIQGYLDKDAFPGPDAKENATEIKGKGTNPMHKVYMITVPGNIMKDEELKKLFNAHIPWGKQRGSFGFEWLAGGTVPKINGETFFEEKTIEKDDDKYIIGGKRLTLEEAAKKGKVGTTEEVLEGTKEIVIPPLDKQDFLEKVVTKKIIPFEMDLFESTDRERKNQISRQKNKKQPPQ